jgi:type IV pilus assembly protein PilQ
LVLGQPLSCRVFLLAALASTALAQPPPPDEPAVSPPAAALLKALGEALNNRGESAAPTAREQSPATQPALATDTVEGAPGRLEVHVRNMDLATLLELLSRQARANIVASTSVSAKVSANLYGVTLEQALDAILIPNKLAHARLDGAIFVGTPEEIAAMMPPPMTEVFTLRYIAPSEAAAAVAAIVGENGRIVEGGPDAGAEGGGAAQVGGSASANYIIVTAHPDQLAAIRTLLDNIDRRPQQVLIEATVLRATLNEDNALGIDFVALSGVDFRAVGSTSLAASNIRPGEVPPIKFDQTLFNINTDFASAGPDGGFTFGFIKNNIGTFVRALEQVTDVVVVANPKIVALNRQEGEVIVGRRDGYITTTVTETAAVQKVEFLETGTQIKFRPVVNDDGSVRLYVHPKDSNGGLTASNLPFEETTEAQADILVNDGDTVLIGGLFRERTTSSRSQIPLLGDIPGLGLLAGNQSDGTTREEVIILLTVRVLKNDAIEKAASESLVQDIERVRVGLRRNLLGIGRERLSQAYYHEALEQLEKGNRDAALFDARLALLHQPKHLGAMRIVERLTQERAWEDDGTRMRALIWELIRPAPTPAPPPPPPFGRPDLDALVPPDEPPQTQGAP